MLETATVAVVARYYLDCTYRRAAETHDKIFAEDKVSNLIVRLRHNVIRAGLRRISLAYSRISLADVASKLGLPSVEDTESIVAKAIRYEEYFVTSNFVCHQTGCDVLDMVMVSMVEYVLGPYV